MPELIENVLAGLQPIELALLSFFVLLFLLRVFYLLFFTGRVAFLKKPEHGKQVPVSLILPFRNEEQSLEENLPQLLAVDNAEFEVVAVDNFSEDNSHAVLMALKEQYKKLRLSSLQHEMQHSEKMTRNLALKAALNDWVMVIPPSATEFGKNWIAEITSQFNTPKEVVVNYSNVKANGSVFNLLFRVEFLFQQLKSFEFILNGLPFITSEDNVAFKKQKYFDVGGYRDKIGEPFANLELVINSFIKKKTTRILLSRETTLRKKQRTSKEEYLELLKKDIRLKMYLSPMKRFWLGTWEWIHLLFLPVSALLVVLSPHFWPVVAVLLCLSALGYSLIIKKILNRLDEDKLFLPSLLFALFLPYFKLFFRAVFNHNGGKKRWKGKK